MYSRTTQTTENLKFFDIQIIFFCKFKDLLTPINARDF